MTTNQTIDGVPRELLLRVLDPYRPRGQEKARKELRALLDSPASCDTCGGSGRFGMGFCECCQEASQPQGVPVAIEDNVEFEKWWMSTPILRKQKIQIAQEAWFARAKLAGRPASVAVVLPERLQWDGLRATACNIRGEGWNACLDELKRLNPSM